MICPVIFSCQEFMDTSREDLLQHFFQLMKAMMRHTGRGVSSGESALSPPQVHMLFAIAHEPEGVSVSRLAEMSGVTPGAITQFVDALVERNLVSREGDPNDRRVVVLKITPFAQSSLEKLKKEHMASMERVLSPLSDDDIRQIIIILSKLDIRQSPEKEDMRHRHLFG
jgi:DNA-binding MarR family transcriptional regulator